jgi:allophanate hydrolase
LIDMTVFTSRRLDAEVAGELAGSRGPLAGVRLAVKDNIDVAGLPTTAGCPEFAYLPEHDAPAVAALRAAGAVVVGKTNVDQIATSLVGGESGSGSAVAVTTGEADLAIDTAGSGRIPAELQGIVGIKPTTGVVSTFGLVAACESYDCVTIFARDVELANRAMGVMAAGARDRVWPADTRLAARPKPVVAVPGALPELDQQGRAAFDAVVAGLAGAGASVVTIDIDPFLAAARLLHDGALVSERYAAVGELIDAHPTASLDPTVRGIIADARAIPAHRLVRDRREVKRLRGLAMNELDGIDALMVPTASMHPSSVNLFDLCAVAAPAGMAGPAQFGITVLARAFEDAVALDIAALASGSQAPVEVWPLAAADSTELVVFGAHPSADRPGCPLGR